MLNLKKKLSAIVLASMMLLSSTGFVFADEKIEDIDTVAAEVTVEESSDATRTTSVVENNDGWIKRGKDFYYNDEDGEVLKGWQNVDGKHYYFWKDGKMANGWSKINNKTYYFTRENGKHTGICKLDNGKTYNFNKEGVLTPGIVRQKGKILYFDQRGKLASTGKSYKSNASAYSGHSTTSTGQKPRWGTIAVDPKVIPYGSKVYIPYFNKTFIANDCGGAIKGTKIDIFMNSSKECYKFGRRNIEIIVLKDVK